MLICFFRTIDKCNKDTSSFLEQKSLLSIHGCFVFGTLLSWFFRTTTTTTTTTDGDGGGAVQNYSSHKWNRAKKSRIQPYWNWQIDKRNEITFSQNARLCLGGYDSLPLPSTTALNHTFSSSSPSLLMFTHLLLACAFICVLIHKK